MKNNHLIIILTIILFIPLVVIAGIKCFFMGMIEQAAGSIEDIRIANKRIKTKITNANETKRK